MYTITVIKLDNGTLRHLNNLRGSCQLLVKLVIERGTDNDAFSIPVLQLLQLVNLKNVICEITNLSMQMVQNEVQFVPLKCFLFLP